MKGGSLGQQFYVDRVPAKELRILLEAHFGGAQADGDSVIYLKGNKPAIAIAQSGGKISSIEPRDTLSQDDVAEIRQKIEQGILRSGSTLVRREICMSAVPVTGSWRYRDQFQIVPAPENAPRPPWLLGEHPFVLEVAFEDSADRLIAQERAMGALKEFNLLLSGLIPAIRASPAQRAQQQWAIPMEPDREEIPEPIWTQPSYFCKSFRHLASRFSDQRDPELELFDHSHFYESGHRLLDDRLVLPTSLEAMIDRVEAMDADGRERFLRWCFWIGVSSGSWSLSTSVGYMALVQAIEALRPQVARTQCEECGQPLPPGPTQQFVEFLDRCVPRQGGENEEERRKLYRLRSALTHGGKLLEMDRGFGFGSFHPGWLKEQNATYLASQLARLAGVNWLLANDE